MKCDVLVVGAGPAGSMAAKTAAEKDVRHRPRPPPLGTTMFGRRRTKTRPPRRGPRSSG